MTFEYLKSLDLVISKRMVNIDIDTLNKIYDEIFEKYAIRKSFDYETIEQKMTFDVENYVVKNFKVEPLHRHLYSKEQKRMFEGYRMSYDMYEKPELCKMIDRLINPDTFDISYNFLESKLASVRQEKIEKLRSETDHEIRKLAIMLDNPEFDYYLSLQAIKTNEKKIVKLCEFDREYALFAKRILDTVNVKEIDHISKSDFEKMMMFFNCDKESDNILIPTKVLKK